MNNQHIKREIDRVSLTPNQLDMIKKAENEYFLSKDSDGEFIIMSVYPFLVAHGSSIQDAWYNLVVMIEDWFEEQAREPFNTDGHRMPELYRITIKIKCCAYAVMNMLNPVTHDTDLDRSLSPVSCTRFLRHA